MSGRIQYEPPDGNSHGAIWSWSYQYEPTFRPCYTTWRGTVPYGMNTWLPLVCWMVDIGNQPTLTFRTSRSVSHYDVIVTVSVTCRVTGCTCHVINQSGWGVVCRWWFGRQCDLCCRNMFTISISWLHSLGLNFIFSTPHISVQFHIVFVVIGRQIYDQM